MKMKSKEFAVADLPVFGDLEGEVGGQKLMLKSIITYETNRIS